MSSMDSNNKHIRTALGIDIGGIFVKFGVVRADGTVLAQGEMPFACESSGNGYLRFIDEMLGVLQGQAACCEVDAVGLAVAGAVKDDTMILLPNSDLDLALLEECLVKRTGVCSICALNDANAAGFAQMRVFGSDAPDSMLFVTLGTGIGAALCLGGSVVQGAHGIAGEIGHVEVEAGGRACGCGRAGCLEQYASSRGLVASYLQARADLGEEGFSVPAHSSDSRAVFEAYERGSIAARAAVDIFAKTLGKALAGICCVVDPGLVVLGGGMAASAELFMPQLHEQFARFCLEACRDMRIEVSRLGNSAGFIGAARAALDRPC